MQTQAHTQAALQAQLEAQTRLVVFDHRTLDEALSAACRQEREMEQYLEEKKASQKRPTATFQRQDKKKMMKDYDAILGLDWLEEHYALVDCRRKRIVFRIPGQIGINLIAAYVVSASTPWTPTLIPASNDMDTNFSDLHALQSQKFWNQSNSPIGELSPNGLRAIMSPCAWERSLSHISKPEFASPTLLLAFLQERKRRRNPILWLRKTPTLEPKIQQPEACSGVLLQQGACWIIEEGFPDLDLLWRLLRNPEGEKSENLHEESQSRN
ncbi:hypothetical protein Taro_021542 [Colocasia esculenta]|uniref:Uncharacterized protein n=1 Tax=Colocasia esculenta TaxID=4460 RepID=A0A843URR2_COLES|nr:hypothetical protein [Colocasia esculenta]